MSIVDVIVLFQVPYLPRFRQTFPNVENFEFLETDIHSLDQLNALSLVQVCGKGGKTVTVTVTVSDCDCDCDCEWL